MSWLTPELLDILWAMVQAVIILLSVVICGALLSWVERRSGKAVTARIGLARLAHFKSPLT